MRSTVFVLTLFLLPGCATLVHGPNQEVVVETQPPGASVFVDGYREGRTPTRLKLSRVSSYDLRIRLEGYEPAQLQLRRERSPWTFGNIVFLYFPGYIVDAAVGSNGKIVPSQISLKLEPDSTESDGCQ